MESIFREADDNNIWVWTDKADKMFTNATTGAPVPRRWQKVVPKSWITRGYVRQSLGA